MSDRLLDQGRGTFSCRIDGRAGYVRLWDDRLELMRSGRRNAGPPEVVPLHSITGISARKPGRLFTAIEVVTAERCLELTFPAVDALRVADLIANLANAAEPPVVAAAVPTVFSPPPDEAWPARPAIAEPDGDVLSVEVPVIEIPQIEMPVWVPLPESESPELVLAQIVIDELAAEPAAPVTAEPISEIEPLPEGSVLAAAAALAELEDLLSSVPPPAPAAVVEAADDGTDPMVATAREILTPRQPPTDDSDDTSVSAPSEAVLTLAAAALLGGARPAVEDEAVESRPERPADIPPDVERRLSRLEVLRSSGIMSEADFADAESEILALVESGRAGG